MQVLKPTRALKPMRLRRTSGQLREPRRGRRLLESHPPLRPLMTIPRDSTSSILNQKKLKSQTQSRQVDYFQLSTDCCTSQMDPQGRTSGCAFQAITSPISSISYTPPCIWEFAKPFNPLRVAITSHICRSRSHHSSIDVAPVRPRSPRMRKPLANYSRFVHHRFHHIQFQSTSSQDSLNLKTTKMLS